MNVISPERSENHLENILLIWTDFGGQRSEVAVMSMTQELIH